MKIIDYKNKFNLKNKTALVIGGFGLIGSEVVNAFAQSHARLIILDKEKKFPLNILKKKNMYYEYFNTNELNKIKKKIDIIFSKYGVPDILINCSYPQEKDWKKSSFKNISLNILKKYIENNLISQSWISRLVAEKMKNKKINGSIIHLGSIYGIVGQDLNIYENTSMKENISYSIIKGGITNLTRQMASYYGKYKIRVNTLVPGGIEYTKNDRLIHNPIFLRNYKKRCPIKRLGKAEEVASAALFLASDASSYVTGSTLVVDGGWTSI